MAQQGKPNVRRILSVLAELSAKRATGTLRFEPQSGDQKSSWEVAFLFRDGELLFASSNRPGERLGEFLVRREILTPEEAQAALTESQQLGCLFHAHLVEARFLDFETLQELLYQRTEELLNNILEADDGRIVFVPHLDTEPNLDVPHVDEQLFARLLRRRKQWPKIYNLFFRQNLVLALVPGVEETEPYQELSHPERLLLSLLDGHRPVREIMEYRKNRLDLMIQLVRYLKDGLVYIAHRSDAPESPTERVEPLAIPLEPTGNEAENSFVDFLSAAVESSEGLSTLRDLETEFSQLFDQFVEEDASASEPQDLDRIAALLASEDDRPPVEEFFEQPPEVIGEEVSGLIDQLIRPDGEENGADPGDPEPLAGAEESGVQAPAIPEELDDTPTLKLSAAATPPGPGEILDQEAPEPPPQEPAPDSDKPADEDSKEPSMATPLSEETAEPLTTESPDADAVAEDDGEVEAEPPIATFDLAQELEEYLAYEESAEAASETARPASQESTETPSPERPEDSPSPALLPESAERPFLHAPTTPKETLQETTELESAPSEESGDSPHPVPPDTAPRAETGERGEELTLAGTHSASEAGEQGEESARETPPTAKEELPAKGPAQPVSTAATKEKKPDGSAHQNRRPPKRQRKATTAVDAMDELSKLYKKTGAPGGMRPKRRRKKKRSKGLQDASAPELARLYEELGLSKPKKTAHKKKDH